MQLGESIDLGSGITGKVIGRTFEEDTRIDLMTPWGVLNGVRVSALAHGLVLNPERADVKTVGTANTAKDGDTVSLETPWGKLNAVPLEVLELHAERRRQMPQSARDAEARANAKGEAQARAKAEGAQRASEQLAAKAGNDAGTPGVRLNRWPRRNRPADRAGRQVA